jgi:hypothetical protein
MTPLGTKRPNVMLVRDYVDLVPVEFFRIELDVPLSPDSGNFDELDTLLRDADKPANAARIKGILVAALGIAPPSPPRAAVLHQKAMAIIRATFP